jgi:DNA polymerase I-like protein with 3'-5' exonuclease and polymerase domains
MLKTLRLLLEFDKAGAEWHVVAYDSGDERMISVHQTGRDPHRYTGHLISGAPEDLIAREDKICGKITDPVELEERRRADIPEIYQGGYFVPRIFTIRQAGKKSNHGLNYGMQYRRFALENEMDENEAKKIVSFYSTKAYPGLEGWWERIRRQLRDNRTLTNCFGRRRRFLETWGPELFMEAYAFIPQSTIVDIFNTGMPRIYDDQSRDFRTLKIKNQVHDSGVFQLDVTLTRDGYASAVRVIRRIAFDYLNPTLHYSGRDFQIRTDLKIGRHWGDDMRGVGLHDGDTDKIARSLQEACEVIIREEGLGDRTQGKKAA